MSKIKNGGLDQYGAESFKQQQFGTAGIEGVENSCVFSAGLKAFCDKSCDRSVDGRLFQMAVCIYTFCLVMHVMSKAE